MEKKYCIPKQIIFVIDNLDPSLTTKLDQYPNLVKALQEGSTSILAIPKSSSHLSPIISLFWFDQSLNDGIIAKQQAANDTIRIFSNQIKGEKIIEDKKKDDDDNLEVKFLTHPKKVSEISDTSVNCLITNNEEIASICESIDMNYYMSNDNDIDYDDVISKFNQQLGNIDIAIFHWNIKKGSTDHDSSLTANSTSVDYHDKYLKNIDKQIEKYLGKCFIKIIFCPFASNVSSSLVIRKNLYQLDTISDPNVKQLIENIVPNQTWRYTRGEKNKLFADDEEPKFCFGITHSKINRTDPIKSFEMLQNPKNWTKFCGGIIWIAGLLREIMFEIGKFPKFGA